MLNLYGSAGRKASDVKIALVLHGEATKSVLADFSYKARFGAEKNPNLAVIGELRKAAQTRKAKVINIGSIDGISVNPMETYAYAASKAGVLHLTRRMALRLISEGIVVSAIAPGAAALLLSAAEEP